MADEKQQPWGDALAPFEREVNGKKTTIWVDLGPVWQGENGALQLTIHSEPLHWRAHNAERRIVIKERDNDTAPEQRPNSNTGRRGAR